ncbi:MAG: U32 family peptidase [Clostridia bacterium]|nr:U32 family peptidase [Clostridia bacterium]
MKKPIELLAPAGDMEALISAISSGANAVYLGVEDFNARKRAKNFTLETVKDAINLCHAHGVKSYITLNTALFDKELPLALDTAVALWNMGVDGFIIADLGLAYLIKGKYPQIEIHASTQCTVHNLDGANFLADKLGFSRVVLARELDRNNIKYISQNASAETEMFVHGAHCMSVSGQCLLSYAMGGRSGNRGECAQPCRLPYQIGSKGGYPLSLKDMSLAGHITEIYNSGVSSLKIEGRMKNKDYVGGTVAVWRELLDSKRNATKREFETLSALFSRQGFTDGYYMSQIDKNMLGVRTDENKAQSLESKAQENFVLEKPAINMSARLIIGENASLTVSIGNKTATAIGDVVESAKTAPMSKEDISVSLSKLGNTPFSLGTLDIEMSEGIMIRKSSLNALRREAIDKLLNPNTPVEKREYGGQSVKAPKKIKTALFSSEGQIPSNRDYFDIVFLYLDRVKEKTKANGICMPPVIFDSQWVEIEAMLKYAKEIGIEYALITNVGQIERVKGYDFKLVFDYRLNVFNGPCVEFLINQGCENIILSPELTLAQARDYKGYSLVAYGKIPVMTTHKCVIKDTVGCESCKTYIKDRQGAKMYAEGIYGHLNVIYNSVPIYMADKGESIKDYSQHFIFIDEDKKECEGIIEAYKKREAPRGAFRRIK